MDKQKPKRTGWWKMLVLLGISLVSIVSAGILWYPPLYRQGEEAPDSRPFITAAQQDLVYINSASLEELMVLPGIGEKRAQSIIEYRNTKGKIESLEELESIQGLGPKICAGIEPYVTFDEEMQI